MTRKTKRAVPGGARATRTKRKDTLERIRVNHSRLPLACQAAVGIAGAVLALSVTANAGAIGYCVIPAWKVPKSDAPEAEVMISRDLQVDVPLIRGFVPKAVPNVVQTNENAAKTYTEADLEMLACVIFQEAGGDEASDETRRMVGEVVLNRVADPRFPDTIEGVLLQKSQFGRMHWTGIVWQKRAANEPEAVERAYRCAEMVFTEPRLLPEDTVWQAEFVQGKEIVVHVDGFYFCR